MIKGRARNKQSLTSGICALSSDPIHGGNIYRAAEELGMHERIIIDFSASINPLGVPSSVSSEIRKNIKYLFNYPDPDSRRLTALLGERLDINPGTIMCGNGSTELIYLVARALKPRKVLIPAPTFSEYERAVLQGMKAKGKRQKAKGKGQKAKGGEDQSAITHFMLRAENNFDIDPEKFIKAMAGDPSLPFDMAFLCNPNNPTGRLLKKDDVLRIAVAAERLKCYLVVDEAFIDFLPQESVTTAVEKNPYLIVLRSMTKFYALSGLRVGYGIFPLHLTGLMRRYREPWTVNTLSQRAGAAAIHDTAYSEETFRVMAWEKEFLEEGLKRLGIAFVPSPVNYYLLRLDRAREITDLLRNKGILVRECSSFAGLDRSYVRIAVKSRRDNTELLKELSGLCRAS